MLLEELLAHIGSNIGLLLSAGFLIGVLHAFEPDHVAAMLTQVGSRDKGQSGRIGLQAIRNSLPGAFWGFGHTSMIMLVSSLVFVFALNIPAAVFDGFELIVGMMLIGLGASMYYKRRTLLGHQHPHSHEDGTTHTHPHRHDGGHSHGHKSYLIGCIHGLAGSGAIIAVGAAAIGDISWGLGFVLVFGMGSAIGMMIISGTLSVPFFLSDRFAKMRKMLRVLAGAITILIGAHMIYGLYTSGSLHSFL